MKRSPRTLDVVCVASALGSLALLWSCGALGLRVNDTPSIPRGLYLTTGEPVARGRHVLVCPAANPLFREALERGYLGSGQCRGASYLMKRVWAVPGDRFAVRDDGVFVNGARVPNSTPRWVDRRGRPLPHYRTDSCVLRPDQYLLLSETNTDSFDGRYFGPVGRDAIVAVIRLLFVWKGDS